MSIRISPMKPHLADGASPFVLTHASLDLVSAG
jgi:hypothetical protein